MYACPVVWLFNFIEDLMAIRHSTPFSVLILHSETQSMHFPTNLTSEEGGMETPEGAPGREPIESCLRATHYALRDTQNELCIDSRFLHGGGWHTLAHTVPVPVWTAGFPACFIRGPERAP